MTDPYLGSRTLMRALLDAVMPQGGAWQPKPGGDLDHFYDGVGDNAQFVKDFLAGLAAIRNPRATVYLDELEREYGITPNTQLTDAQRRATLLLIKYARDRRGTINNLQDALDRSGFGTGGYGLHVYANDPPVDPGPFTTYSFITMAGEADALCGYNTDGSTNLAVCGVSGGLWVINGDVYVATPNYLGCGDPVMCCGYYPVSAIMAECGIYYTLSYMPVVVTSPADPWCWPLVFFIAAGATRNNSWLMNDIAPVSLAQAFAGQAGYGAGGIATLSMGSIPGNQRQALIEIIMRWKPSHTWCALMCNFN